MKDYEEPCSTCGGIGKHDPACPILTVRNKAAHRAEMWEVFGGVVVFVAIIIMVAYAFSVALAP